MNRNLNPEVLAVALSTAAETNFSGCDGNPAERPASGFARLRINLGGANAKAQVRIWATGRDPEMLRILLASTQVRRRYDPGKHEWVEMEVAPW